MPDIYTDVADLQRKIKRALGGALPTYGAITLASASYSIVGKGVYEITVASLTNEIIFPDPNLNVGQTITIIHTDTSVNQAVSATNRPYSKGSVNGISFIAFGSMYTFVSINGKWRGGALA